MRWRPLQLLMQLFVALTVPRTRVGVTLVLFNPQEQVLLLKHVFHPTAPWGLPGGWLQRYEAPAAGAARELHEETGLNVSVGPPLLVTNHPQAAQIDIIFSAETGEHQEPMKLSHEILASDWFEVDNLPAGMLPVVYDAVEAAAERRYGRTQQNRTEETVNHP